MCCRCYKKGGPVTGESKPVCRSCGKSGLQSIMSFGQMPLADFLPAIEQLKKPDRTFPLKLVFCPDCALVQITDTAPADIKS